MDSQNLDDHRRNFTLFMRRHNLTGYGWANLAGVTEGTIRSYLKGRSKSLNYKILSKLAKSVNVDPEDILNPSTSNKARIESSFFLDKNVLIDSMDQIDKLIENKNMNISNKERQKLYFSLCELKINFTERSDNSIKELFKKA